MTLEAPIELEVVAWAENHGWLVRKMQYVGRRGAPDRLFVGFGLILVIEFKRPGKHADPLQSREHNRFRERGVAVPVVDNVRDGIAFLRRHMPVEVR